jgi:transcriptional regulator with XRE-family HTH domain
MSDIGAYLKTLRKQKRLTLREAAAKAEMSNAYLSQIESGQRGVPNASMLRRLAMVYDVPVREAFEVAGLLEAAEAETEEVQIDRAFEFVMADTRFQAGTRVKEGLTTEAKKYIVEVYERVTGARLLGLR